MTVETKFPSLVFVRLSVHNSIDGKSYSNNSNPLATYTVKLDNLQQGYRHIPLNNAANERFYFSTLFCRVHKSPILPLIPQGNESAEEDLDTQSIVDTGVGGATSARAGIFKRVFGRTPSLRKKEHHRDAPVPISAATFPQSAVVAVAGTTGAAGLPLTVRRVASEDGALDHSRSQK